MQLVYEWITVQNLCSNCFKKHKQKQRFVIFAPDSGQRWAELGIIDS